MLRKTVVALGFGLLWLFVFSIPVGQNKKVFDLAWFYVVDTKPVHWVTNSVSGGIDATTNSAKDAADSIVGRVDKNWKQAKQTGLQVE